MTGKIKMRCTQGIHTGLYQWYSFVLYSYVYLFTKEAGNGNINKMETGETENHMIYRPTDYIQCYVYAIKC